MTIVCFMTMMRLSLNVIAERLTTVRSSDVYNRHQLISLTTGNRELSELHTHIQIPLQAAPYRCMRKRHVSETKEVMHYQPNYSTKTIYQALLPAMSYVFRKGLDNSKQ
jgi:hypothetical protein